MALYIKDPDVAALAAELAVAMRTSRVKAVREALRRALEQERGRPSLADLAVGFCRELRARGKPTRGRVDDKAFYDSLSGDC